MNEDAIRKRIRVLLDEIQNEADPVLLNRCRSLFRREVSFFRRSYMAAYLLLLAEEGKAAADKKAAPANKRRGDSENRDKRRHTLDPARDKARAETPRLSEEESARIFISTGRNRKVFARDLLALVNAKAKVARDDIGAIRILDNYSFIQVRNSAADTVIAALNGETFRGRPLTVNYARSRDEENEQGLPEPETGLE